MRLSSALRVRAHAKINLSLRVLGRRPDGYHDLRTVFQSILLHDTLFLVPHDGPLAISTTDPAVPADRTNIVWRAADALWRAGGRRGAPRGVRIHIVKRIPAGGGLAGGSSDAAAALRALERAWRIDLAASDRLAVARDLGADVPFFLHGGTALGLERGDVIFPLADLGRAWLVLLTPPFAVPTSSAFAWFDRTPASARVARPQVWNPLLGPAAEVLNDLEAAVARHHPPLTRLRNALHRSGAAAAALSGSGSTLFGVFRSKNAADSAAMRLARQCPAHVSRFLGRADFERSSRPAAARGLPRGGPIG